MANTWFEKKEQRKITYSIDSESAMKCEVINSECAMKWRQ